MVFNSSLQHLRERLPLPAIGVLDTKPEVNFQSGRFFIQQADFESQVAVVTFQFWKIKTFCFFVINSFQKIINKGFVHGDIKVFSNFLRVFLDNQPTDPKALFKKVCFQFPFEFLIMFDFFRENATESFNVSLL